VTVANKPWRRTLYDYISGSRKEEVYTLLFYRASLRRATFQGSRNPRNQQLLRFLRRRGGVCSSDVLQRSNRVTAAAAAGRNSMRLSAWRVRCRTRK